MEPATLRVVPSDGSMMPSAAEDDKRRDGEPTLWALDKQMAVLSERMTSLTTTVGSRFDVVDRKMDEATARYATKEELSDVRKLAEALQAQIGWAVKIVLGLVLAGLIGLLLSKNGVPHV